MDAIQRFSVVSVRPVKCHTLTECGRKVEASDVSFRPESESYGDPLPPLTPIRYLIPFPKAGNVLMTPLGLRIPVAGGEHLLSDCSPAR
ncbi:hypothetical protein EVAR_26917_1 [Eumeta japonica]|uniref:Uncharacterized protein n=1 Tax=Eumeta variegata TaxID=151549 RepID=A0A4C1VVD2_EUMVA|nr:hypothetical protein EVAR_26917_1 [Eumeta japonica]